MQKPRAPTAAPFVCVVLAAVLAACGQGNTGAAPAAAAASPSDPKLARLYDQTCRACHGAPGTGAPLSGDRAAWEPRLEQGLPTLVDHTINGYKGMPPLGGCMDCSESDFEALIRFMASAPPS